MSTKQTDATLLMARVYRVILVAMILILTAAAITAMLGSGYQSRVVSLLIEGFALTIPFALAVFTVVTLVRKQTRLGMIALLLTLLWGVFKIIG